uniref:ADP-ribose pyrophosphatase, mitochondrial (Trinotate prediction) n=1 Tax=Henneguya salminicola TaxID=69463 RepID=A0A6G3MDP5_HENSL
MSLNHKYPGSKIIKAYVPKNLSSWSVEYPNYNPVYYTSPRVLRHPSWADDDSTQDIKFNQNDEYINRVSYTGHYSIAFGVPRNPVCRTGIIGRGLLGKWGPNHAVDIIISRWKKNGFIEFICITRKYSGNLAFPGGMVDNGETENGAMVREAMEEVFNLKHTDELKRAAKWLKKNIPNGNDLYMGYIHDSRNTDNAWIETRVRGCIEKNGDKIDFNVNAGSDAGGAFWITASNKLNISYHHKSILKTYCNIIGAKF